MTQPLGLTEPPGIAPTRAPRWHSHRSGDTGEVTGQTQGGDRAARLSLLRSSPSPLSPELAAERLGPRGHRSGMGEHARVRGHVCGQRGHVRRQRGLGGGQDEPAGRWSLTDEEVALALPAVPQAVDKRVPDLSLGTQSREGERPLGERGSRGGGSAACRIPPPTPPQIPPLTWMLTSSLHCFRVSRRSTSTLGITWGGARWGCRGGRGGAQSRRGTPRTAGQHPP